MVDGDLWVEQRRFILRHLRDFGFGRTDMAVQIEFESAQLVKYYSQMITEKSTEFSPDKTNPVVAPCLTEQRTVNRKKNGRIYQLESDYPIKDKKEEDEEPMPEKEEPKRSLTAEDFYLKVGDDLEIRRAAKVSGIIVEMEDFFGVPVLNALWCMMAGKR